MWGCKGAWREDNDEERTHGKITFLKQGVIIAVFESLKQGQPQRG